MKIRLEYCAQVRDAAGIEEEDLACEAGTTPAALLKTLAERRGEKIRALLLDAAGKPQRGVLFLLNEEPVPPEQLGERELRDGDKLTVLPAMAGG